MDIQEDMEKIINRIVASPSGASPEDVYESVKETYPNLSTDDFYLAWKAAEFVFGI